MSDMRWELADAKAAAERAAVTESIDLIKGEFFAAMANHCALQIKRSGCLCHGEELIAEAVSAALLQGSSFDAEDFRKVGCETARTQSP